VEITRADGDLVLSGFDIFLLELLRQIPVSADPGDSDAAKARIFSKPSNDAGLNSDWESYVEPELAQIFQSANETVTRDLTQCEEEKHGADKEYSLRIPASHLDAWLSSLNQARLALAARHGFTETDLDHDNLASVSTARELSLFQIHFYGFLQECILREMT
jgi:hypothetical protein